MGQTAVQGLHDFFEVAVLKPFFHQFIDFCIVMVKHLGIEILGNILFGNVGPFQEVFSVSCGPESSVGGINGHSFEV